MKAPIVALSLALALAAGCRRGPAPAYPTPQDPPLEDTDLAPYLETRTPSPDANGATDAGDASNAGDTHDSD